MHGSFSGGTSVVFMWVPSLVGLACNSAADIASKTALLLPVSTVNIPHSDYNPPICTQALKQWQLCWNSETQNKLHVNQM